MKPLIEAVARPTFYSARRNRGQSSLEYAVVMVAIVGALLGMYTYIQRGMQGRLKQTTDQLGTQWYEPEKTTGNYTTSENSLIVATSQQLSERQLTDSYGYPVDLDGDGVIEDDVYATEQFSEIRHQNITKTANEHVEP